MLKIFTSVLFFMLTFRVFSQNLPSLENTDFPKELISMDVSNVQSVTYRTYSIKNDTVSSVENNNEIFYFIGATLSKQSKIDPITKDVIYTKKYDCLGRIISENHFNKDAFRPITIYSYDESKHIATMLVLRRDSICVQKRVNYFNSQNKIAKIEVVDMNNTLICTHLFHYNKKGDLIKNCFYNTPNGPRVTLDASFTGNKTEFTLNPNDSTIYKYKYNWLRKTTTKDQYDARLRPISRTVYTSKKDTLLTIEYSIGENFKRPVSRKTTKLIQNKRIELNEHFDENKHVSSSVKFVYMDDDYMEGSSNNPFEKSTYKHEYQFDEHGNWIVKNRYRNNKLWSVTKREIKYK